VISDMLHEIMTSSEVTTGDVIGINNAIRDIFVNTNEVIAAEATAEAESAPVVVDSTTAAVTENTTNVTNNPAAATENAIVIETGQQPQVNGQVTPEQALNPNQVQSGMVETEAIISNQTESTAVNQAQVMENELGTQVLNTFASEKQIDSFNTILNTLPDFPKDNHEIFAENGSLKADADMNQVFREITDYLNNHPDIPKQTLNDIIGAPLYKGLLKNIITNSFAMEPKEVTKPGEISKLYERVLKQTEALERLVANFNNKAADTIKTQTSQIKQNVNFMNSANEMYNFIQIPLKMYNQNTDSMLYVRQNKKASYEQGEEITAFLHFDMEYLGSTDVFISLKESKVGCKWNLASEDSMKLIEDNLDILTERLAKKGFSVTSEVTCGEPKKSFVEDFLGAAPVSTENTSEGIVHRYSFDMRA